MTLGSMLSKIPKLLEVIADLPLITIGKIALLVGGSLAVAYIVYNRIRARYLASKNKDNESYVDKGLAMNYANPENAKDLHPGMDKIVRNIMGKDMYDKISWPRRKSRKRRKTTAEEKRKARERVANLKIKRDAVDNDGLDYSMPRRPVTDFDYECNDIIAELSRQGAYNF